MRFFDPDSSRVFPGSVATEFASPDSNKRVCILLKPKFSTTWSKFVESTEESWPFIKTVSIPRTHLLPPSPERSFIYVPQPSVPSRHVTFSPVYLCPSTEFVLPIRTLPPSTSVRLRDCYFGIHYYQNSLGRIPLFYQHTLHYPLRPFFYQHSLLYTLRLPFFY
jgi:hypothetical protein